MSKAIFHLENLKKAYGTKVILDEINLSFLEGARIGVIGHNGSGKSTLLNLLAGVDKEYDGVCQPIDGLTIGYVPQEPELDASLNVREHLKEAVAPIRNLISEYEELTASLGDLEGEAMEKAMARMERLQTEIDHVDAWDLDRQLDQAAHALCLPPNDADVSVLSGGEKRRIALCWMSRQTTWMPTQ